MNKFKYFIYKSACFITNLICDWQNINKILISKFKQRIYITT